jgi:hypothetical protein
MPHQTCQVVYGELVDADRRLGDQSRSTRGRARAPQGAGDGAERTPEPKKRHRFSEGACAGQTLNGLAEAILTTSTGDPDVPTLTTPCANLNQIRYLV